MSSSSKDTGDVCMYSIEILANQYAAAAAAAAGVPAAASAVPPWGKN